MGQGAIDSINVAQDMDQWQAPVDTVANLCVPDNYGKFFVEKMTDDFSRRIRPHGARQSSSEGDVL
jgi:hypothetical protein